MHKILLPQTTLPNLEKVKVSIAVGGKNLFYYFTSYHRRTLGLF
jgi:hypothetical protein